MADEETRSSANSETEGMGKEDQEMGENEEFYETIEAPKFVDFNLPEYHRPDDRYWFCLRVGCDQKHEEEMDSEAIYKNFVLRVMAARSPNVRLHKALNRDCSRKNLKCPQSVPPKSSKSRLSRLAVISSVSLKMDDNKVRVKPKPVSKLCSTPKAKGKEVAAKYLTTPRNKKCIAKADVFRSVQSTKPSVVVPKDRAVAKTLTFPSPKKAFNLKASVELRTPLSKLCDKMKKLEITSQKKTPRVRPSQQSKQCGDRPKKSLPIKSSARQKVASNDKCNGKVSPKSITRKNKQEAESTKGKSLQRLHGRVKQVHFANEIEDESRDEVLGDQCSRDLAAEEAAVPILRGPSSDASESKSNFSSNSPQQNVVVDDVLTSQSSIKEDNGSQGRHKTEIADSDDKENTTAFDENRSFRHKNDNSGRNILGIQNSDRKKVTDAVVKENGAPGLRPMKLKPTNPKPFKFRTDERGILREANLEKKNNAIGSQKEHHDSQKRIAGLKPIKKETMTRTPTGSKVHHTKHDENKPMTLTCESNTRRKLGHVSKKISSNGPQPQRNLDFTSQAKTGTVNTSSGNSIPKERGRQCKKTTTRVAAGSPVARTVTSTLKEPNFHRSPLMPKSCAS
ncbi:OLC1v1002815C1 [Oldenlandia corymbosa var. corymbosa]|uniref:OLC1v1002815C1 n=1 Tax=Oldenlandia corymbosa var. corymbosa TaxID=529605 RepID=A0AAV1DBG2_OLDCO|nr:OLC1v1002815C1 [Oldenlandia corymbosa var. corymbosa]